MLSNPRSWYSQAVLYTSAFTGLCAQTESSGQELKSVLEKESSPLVLPILRSQLSSTPGLSNAALPARTKELEGNLAQVTRIETANFLITAESRSLAETIATLAESHRKSIATEWLGQELPQWPEPCPIQVTLAHDNYGDTSYELQEQEDGSFKPTAWECKIHGSLERLQDSVLPHELVHMILASHFQQRIPRWADEGIALSVEHASVQQKIQDKLAKLLTDSPERSLSVKRLLTLKDYPTDFMPVYLEGYSVANFLIEKQGKRYFVNFLEASMPGAYRNSFPSPRWERSLQQYYGIESVEELEIQWRAWLQPGKQEN
ncbi:MAG: hypothetical protein KDD62_14495 [Bdellovibrionales bacterium]|nr:hypothetical protein [Bdellovibrionales bacterium]